MSYSADEEKPAPRPPRKPWVCETITPLEEGLGGIISGVSNLFDLVLVIAGIIVVGAVILPVLGLIAGLFAVFGVYFLIISPVVLIVIAIKFYGPSSHPEARSAAQKEERQTQETEK